MEHMESHSLPTQYIVLHPTPMHWDVRTYLHTMTLDMCYLIHSLKVLLYPRIVHTCIHVHTHQHLRTNNSSLAAFFAFFTVFEKKVAIITVFR